MAQTQLASKMLSQDESIIKHGINYIFNPTKKNVICVFFLGKYIGSSAVQNVPRSPSGLPSRSGWAVWYGLVGIHHNLVLSQI
jgi:hypothetical protein